MNDSDIILEQSGNKNQVLKLNDGYFEERRGTE